MRIIGLTGYARSGKDTVGSHLVDKHGFYRIGFADPVRAAALAIDPLIPTLEPGHDRLSKIVEIYGWDYAKVAFPEVRQVLQRIGTEVGRQLMGGDVWIELAWQTIQNAWIEHEQTKFVITDVRFPNEAEFVRRNEGVVWRIDRPGVGPVNDHASDRLDFMPDVVIPNNGTIDDLFYEVDSLL